MVVIDIIWNAVLPLHSIPLGELPPPPPRACFGREKLIGEVVSLAENITPIALVGAGGIGKTSVALTVLHHGRIKERFGDNRRFIRCDQFPASRANLLNRLSRAIGAGVENPEDLVPLRPSLSSTEMLLIFDNAESILDPQGPNGQEIYEVVEELSQFNNICLFITSRITTIPPDFKRLSVTTLPMGAAASAFYRICNKDDRPDLVNDILEQLDFHPLSITLLATVAYQNDWDNGRLAREWGRRQTDMLQTDHNRSLAAAIELSLASPMFQGLGPDARGLLGVVAFFPQGVDEGNLDWLFSTISDRATIFDKFCNLSLTYRSNGFFTMLAPLRDYLCPKDPKASPILCATKDCYLARISIELDPDDPTFGETRWIVSEDLNAEHLLDVFTSIDPNSADVWYACGGLLRHLYFHKKRRTIVGPKIENLPDDHPAKPHCLLHLSWNFDSVGNYAEQERLLIHTLKLERDQGDEARVGLVLRDLSDANRMQGRFKEGIQYAREGLEILQRTGPTVEQVFCLVVLAWSLYYDEQLGAAKETVSQAINLLPKKGEEFHISECQRLLGNIYRFQGEKEKAIHHLQVALGIASAFNWHDQLFWVHYSLAELFLDKEELDEAHVHINQAKTHTVDHMHYMGRAVWLNALIWRKQGRFGEAVSETLRAIEIFEKLGSTQDAEGCRDLLRDIERAIESQSAADVDGPDFDSDGKLLETIPLPMSVNPPVAHNTPSGTFA